MSHIFFPNSFDDHLEGERHKRLESKREMVWTDGRCAYCERLAYKRRDGREYLYRYEGNGPVVCKPKCHEKAEARERSLRRMRAK